MAQNEPRAHRRPVRTALSLLLSVCVLFSLRAEAANNVPMIKWVDFKVSEAALKDAMQADVNSYGTERHISWIGLLSVLAVRYGGDFARYKKADLTKITDAYTAGQSMEELAGNEKLYA